MHTATINSYKITIFNSYNGTQLFIENAKGETIYAYKVSGDPMERAAQVIAQQ
jgi:hypothetical protein